MSMPEIPEKNQEQSLVDILESIALEETALAHYVNAEAEKVQCMVDMMYKDKMDYEKAMKFQKQIEKNMRLPIKKEILLQFKLEDVLEAKEKKKDHHYK